MTAHSPFLLTAPSARQRAACLQDSFSYNEKFSSNLKRVRIPMASLEMTHDKKRVEEDRSFAIDAAIVRTMKTRNVMGHPELIAQVLDQLRFFHPQPKAIKKRIESLIEREYIERGENASQYKYLA